MKKLLIGCYFFLGFLSTSVLADVTNNLQNRLKKIQSIYTKFSQNIKNSNGDIIQESTGELWIKRPNFFKWHIIFPDEIVIISDSKTIWIYNLLLEQVIATRLNKIMNQMMFILIFHNNINDWKKYNVKQQGDNFELIPKFDNDNILKFFINITKDGIIKQFITIEKDGKINTYILKYQKHIFINSNKFIFIIPKGVMLDDQRK
ncbi:Outer-membrane lipoprotein carrier protein [Serratia symbiotica]|nr:Outer-membrane lipoprotein carrier protein [Serratia symbiotica]